MGIQTALLKSIDKHNKPLGSHFLFSAQNPVYPEKNELKMDHDKVLHHLKNAGYKAHGIEGHYGSPEKSIMVHDVSPGHVKLLHNLASRLGQESSIHVHNGKNEMKFHHGPMKGQSVHGSGTVWHKEKPKDMYSTINGKHFTHNFNFDEKKAVNKSEDFDRRLRRLKARKEGHNYAKKDLLEREKEPLEKGEKGDWTKEGYTIHHDNYNPVPQGSGNIQVHAKDKHGNKVGSAEFSYHSPTHIKSDTEGLGFQNAPVTVRVHPDHRRKGLATAMYQHAEKVTGKKIKNIGKNKRTDQGNALWNQPKRSFGKSEALEKGAIKNAVAGAMMGATSIIPQAHAQHHEQVHAPKQTSSYDRNKMLNTIAQIESSGGKNVNHKPTSHGQAFGAWAVMPDTIRETIKMHPNLRHKYGGVAKLQDKDLHNYMQQHPGLDRVIASSHLDRLAHHFNKNPEHVAFAYNQGITGTNRAIKDKFDISSHPYTQKFKQLYNKSIHKSEDTNLVHYSPHENLTVVDPKFKGTGVDSKTKGRDTWHPHSFYYREGTPPESVVTQKGSNKYHAKINSKDHPIYDLGEDKHKFVDQAIKENNGALNMDLVHDRIKSSGHKGFHNSKHDTLKHVVAMYEPLKVKRAA